MLRSGHDDFDLPFAFTIFVNLRIEGNRPGHKINPTHNNADQEYFIGMNYCDSDISMVITVKRFYIFKKYFSMLLLAYTISGGLAFQ